MVRFNKLAVWLLTIASLPTLQSAAVAEIQSELAVRSLVVDEANRDYLIAIPSNATGKKTESGGTAKKGNSEVEEARLPLVFVWHGHGGNMRHSSRSFGIHTIWPEAIVVYGQGLPTPGMTDPEGKKNGWQKSLGDQKDRDLRYFDSLLKTIRQDYPIDESKIYSMGHSNGAAFTYLLAVERPEIFAAIAPSAAPARGVGVRAVFGSGAAAVPAIPVFHIAGKNDPIVPYKWQVPTIEAFKSKNQCNPLGKPWEGKCIQFESKTNKPVLLYEHEGGHQFPVDAPKLIVTFFKSQTK